ncbi:MAG: hypothetical protein JWQ25_1765 [Daejeonella sp.]|nr:hypothetical protein [Daejeonella sp.]
MNLQAEKIEVVKLLLDNNDIKLISAIKALLENRVELLPSHIVEEIKIAQQQVDNNQYATHDQVMKKYAKYL